MEQLVKNAILEHNSAEGMSLDVFYDNVARIPKLVCVLLIREVSEPDRFDLLQLDKIPNLELSGIISTIIDPSDVRKTKSAVLSESEFPLVMLVLTEFAKAMKLDPSLQISAFLENVGC